ncbi:MAG: hypothetical protein IJ785_05130 [Bacteroidales bacterium]|nr:hypothetical protein [Bacteroidales bacterium]
MKRTLASLLTLLTLSGLSVFTSCQKETTGDGTQFRATMEGCTARDSKTTLDETFLYLNWVEGDQVAIYGTAGRGLYAATPQTPATTAVFDNVSGTTGDGPFRAFYPASLTTDGASVTLPATQTYEVNSIHEFPMYAQSATNQLAFKNLCGALRLILVEANTNITSISITANTAICGDYAVSHVDDVPYLSYTGNGSNTVTMNFSTPLSIGDTGRYFYFALPAFDSLKSITITTDDGRYCTKTVKSNVCINVQRSEMTTIVFLDNDMDFVEPLPEGALPGLFSVSATQQVRFSKGNLQYQASTDTWRFAENQWDYVGNESMGTVYENGVKSDNALIGATYNGWIDLFGWGTGNNPTLTSTDNSDYITSVDWGVNAISNGGSEPNTWHTLSIDEWDYLFHTRANAPAKIASGSVNGVHGLILLPDSWTLPENCTFNAGFSRRNWTLNTYSLTEWAAMEDAGAIFLPASGRRWGTSISWVGGGGYQWASSQCYIVFYFDYTLLQGSGVNSNGFSVRLVRNNN